MGMFDTLRYENIEYQTKEFECLLETYRIVNKRLLKDDYHYELEEDSRLKKIIDRKDVDQNFHGIFEAHYIDGRDQYKSVLFKFTNGDLVEVIGND